MGVLAADVSEEGVRGELKATTFHVFGGFVGELVWKSKFTEV
jgi:hypothetical protein